MTSGSTAYTDVNTLLEDHARRRADKIFIASDSEERLYVFEWKK